MNFIFFSKKKITSSETNLNNRINITKENLISGHWFVFFSFLCLKFLWFINCTKESKHRRITFALVDLNWKEEIDKRELCNIKYWLSCSNEGGMFIFCYGNHDLKVNRFGITNFVCSLGRLSQNHQPLHSFEVNYRDDWKIKFRALNKFLYMHSEEIPFLFEYYLNVNYQEFEILVKLLTFDSGALYQNLTYENFYRFLKIVDFLNPISSEYLNNFYSHLYKSCLLGNVSAIIFKDSKHYREQLFDKKHRIRPFVHFFGALIDSMDACFIPERSMLSLFKKTNQNIDQCFRGVNKTPNLILKISSSFLESLMKIFKSNDWLAFNWLLSVTKIHGFCIDDTETTCNELKVSSIFGSVCPETVKKTIFPLKKISVDFFLNLSGSNIKEIQYLKFANVDISFDLIDIVIIRAAVLYLEISYCSVDKDNQITELLQKMYEPNTFKVSGLQMNTRDVERILYSSIKVLVLKYCTLNIDSNWKPKRDQRGEFKIAENLKFLDISLSRFPLCFVQLLLNSTKLENILLNFFEFTECRSFDPLLIVKRNWNNLEVDQYISNDYLKALFTGDISVNSLCLRRIMVFNEITFFFEVSGLQRSVTFLDLSENNLTVNSLNIICNFYNLKHLNLSQSLPLNIDGLIHSKTYENVTHLDVSYSDISLSNYLYITRFKNLKVLSLSGIKMKCGLLGLILTDQIINSLAYLDITNVSLDPLNFKRISNCIRLTTLLFSFGGPYSMNKYFDILKSTFLGERLSILSVSTSNDISIDDVLSLAIFSDLSEAKIECSTIINRHEKDLMSYNSIYSDFRIQFVLRKHITDIRVVEILKEIFEHHSISIVYEETL